MRIDGRTRLAGVVGWPIDRTLSPAMHNAAYEALELNWVYLPFPVQDQGGLVRFVDAVRALPFVGFNVTMPYKQAILPLCDEVAMFAQMADAVNTVHCVDGTLVGYNTDGRGLIDALKAEVGFDPAGKKAVVIGAGGAAGAAVVGLIVGKASSVAVVNRSVERAEAIVERMRPYLRGASAVALPLDRDAREAVESADLVINATPVGMVDGDPSPVPPEWLHEGQVVCDMIYQRPETDLMRVARDAGATVIGGLPMLVEQGALAIEIWSGASQLKVPRDVMRRAAEEALARPSAAESER
ncbi:shikimate 5-dehydrogenase [Coriobacteriaceae bacterium EMTCatB1]|nr:shikimate 5-dehydrogenase [Coriobacteriaceae bacterium EMTCatB1]